MSPASAILQRALDILRSKCCWCMRAKYANHPFCGHCYQKLNGDMRTVIGQRGAAFVEHYDQAVVYLKQHVRPAKAVPSKQAQQYEYPD